MDEKKPNLLNKSFIGFIALFNRKLFLSYKTFYFLITSR
jgi:hypothetical protein